MTECECWIDEGVPPVRWFCESCRTAWSRTKFVIPKMDCCPYQKGECMYPRECPDCSGDEE